MKPILVLIRDGWGYRKEKYLNGPKEGYTPFTDKLMKEYPNTLLDASGEAVGLPQGYQGNSEVGHMTIGAGRIFYQSLVKINKSIKDKSFFQNTAFLKAINNCKKNNSVLHICGLIQKEGVHSHLDHCIALLDMCKENRFTNVAVHCITDGRDSPVQNSLVYIKIIQNKLKKLGFGKIVSISGRFFSMDRDNRWERTKKAYDCIVDGKSELKFTNPVTFIQKCYSQKIFDEFIIPATEKNYDGIKKNDSFIFFNFRIDRPRQLTKAIIETKFEGWERKPKNICFVSMTEYYNPISKKAITAFKPEPNLNLLTDILEKNKLKQLRISETEKYAHVTFFFNGQNETPNKGEERILIHSPKVETYDLKPEMSIYEITEQLNLEIDKNKFDVIITNFVNGDMVGHTGNWEAVLKAVKAVDDCVEKVVNKILSKNGTVLVFADHGNCEDMTELFKTSHTTNKVPFILVNKELKQKFDNKKIFLKENMGLKDITPTILKLLNLNKTSEMTGESIFEEK